jgi:hypothetical protein
VSDEAVHFDWLKEGLCPRGHGPLDRRYDHGWCEECHIGWSIEGKTFTVHFDFKSSELTTADGVLRSGPGTVKWVSDFDDAFNRMQAVLNDAEPRFSA